tara:strand:- start:1764 stop:1979 length:216 start_codon:yes stop_codon:yes gene_type:complete
LIIINHRDCGAAKIVSINKEFDEQNETKIHLNSFFKLQKIINRKFPKLKTDYYLLSLNKKIKKFNISLNAG